jgi:hypothetical protein
MSLRHVHKSGSLNAAAHFARARCEPGSARDYGFRRRVGHLQSSLSLPLHRRAGAIESAKRTRESVKRLFRSLLTLTLHCCLRCAIAGSREAQPVIVRFRGSQLSLTGPQPDTARREQRARFNGDLPGLTGVPSAYDMTFATVQRCRVRCQRRGHLPDPRAVRRRCLSRCQCTPHSWTARR